ncbi:MAG TPA: hypothetical protein VIY09_08810, partial [Rhizomicrobium sp.]
MLNRLFASIVKIGTLTLITADGRRVSFGSGAPEIAMRLHDRAAFLELALNPELKLGELYMDGRLTVENGDVADLLDLLMHNLSLVRPRGVLALLKRCRRVTRWLAQHNHSARARRNVAHHYDLSA